MNEPEDNRPGMTPNPDGKSSDSTIRVEVEREFVDFEQPHNFVPMKPPFLATWICLALAWFFLVQPVPFTIFIGLPINIAALILALVCLTRGAVRTGVLVLILGTVGSLAAYFLAWVLLLGKMAA